MADAIAGAPFWQLGFDAQGNVDTVSAQAVRDAVTSDGITDLMVFSHGWNNSVNVARRLYEGFFGQLVPQVPADLDGVPVKVGLVGVFWPSQRWSDEPEPDFAPPAVPAGAAGVPAAGGGAAGLTRIRASAAPAASSTIDAVTLGSLKAEFPEGAAHLDAMAALLDGPVTKPAMAEFVQHMKAFQKSTATGSDDGEQPGHAKAPGMLEDEPEVLFRRYAAQLQAQGVPLADAAAQGGGEAGLTDRLKGMWNGAKEALRQLTYWQMKGRAGVVGQQGLGPFLLSVAQSSPSLRIHLVGHSFGARVVSYALTAMPATESPVKGVTLLEGAFSHFAFADPLPFDAHRSGALKGMLARIDGPLAVCYSIHDAAVGTFYPLASITAQEDSSAAQDRVYRWGGMGHDGAQGVGALRDILQPAGPKASYRFAKGKALNIDSSEIVCHGGAPSGAHSDIVHPELSWVVLKAGALV